MTELRSVGLQSLKSHNALLTRTSFSLPAVPPPPPLSSRIITPILQMKALRLRQRGDFSWVTFLVNDEAGTLKLAILSLSPFLFSPTVPWPQRAV